MKQRTKIAIALGSNLGARENWLAEAFTHLREDLLEDAKGSRVYETEPWGDLDQPHFLNAVVVGFTDWGPAAIVNYLKRLEAEMGRVPSRPSGPRLIDLDLLAYGEKVFHAEGVEVPHPRMSDRDFVLLPLAEVWGDWKHPTLGLSAKELADRCPKRYLVPFGSTPAWP